MHRFSDNRIGTLPQHLAHPILLYRRIIHLSAVAHIPILLPLLYLLLRHLLLSLTCRRSLLYLPFQQILMVGPLLGLGSFAVDQGACQFDLWGVNIDAGPRHG